MLKRSKRIFLIISTVWQQQLLLLFYPYLPKLLQNILKALYTFSNFFHKTDKKHENFAAQLAYFTNLRGMYLRQTLESLGPIFIKLGQMISTRADLIPYDIAIELNKLQDQVPSFAFSDVQKIIEKQFNRPLFDVYQSFDEKAIASASMAQVHFAVLKTGQKVAVKVLRPNMEDIINTDIALMYDLAKVLAAIMPDAKRLKLPQTIHELEKHLNHELDLMREAANASQLKRNMQAHKNTCDLIDVPEIYFDHCRTKVLTMQRMHGIGISKTQQLLDVDVDLPKLARDGVEIFFSQVFRDGFFHADMHPGNILVDIGEHKGRYIALDFGIMGTLSEFDKHYLAHNFLAFFERDYHRVAQLHVESEWVPKNTNIEELEAAIRTCCEPYFDKPLKDISLGIVLMRLFQTSREFHVEIQPQLTMLQKTLLNIEGLGRQLDPDLDLWQTAKPILKKWMNEQIGYKNLIKHLKTEGMQWGKILPQLPRLFHEQLLRNPNQIQLEQQLLLKEQQKTNRYLFILTFFMSGFIIASLLLFMLLLKNI